MGKKSKCCRVTLFISFTLFLPLLLLLASWAVTGAGIFWGVEHIAKQTNHCKKYCNPNAALNKISMNLRFYHFRECWYKEICKMLVRFLESSRNNNSLPYIHSNYTFIWDSLVWNIYSAKHHNILLCDDESPLLLEKIQTLLTLRIIMVLI